MVSGHVDKAEERSDVEFRYEIVSGEQHPDYQVLLGRTLRYVLNVKVVTSSGEPLRGTKFELERNGTTKHISVTGDDKEHESTLEGVDFLIYGAAFDHAGSHADMNFDLRLKFTADTGYSHTMIYKMGRLQRWGKPVATLSPDKRNIWFRISTEWLTEEPSVSWHWSKNIMTGHMSIPTLGVSKQSFTTPVEGSGTGLNGRVECVHAIPIETFAGLDKVNVEFPVSISDDGYTATLPITYEVELPPR